MIQKDTNCTDIKAVEEFLRTTENLLHHQHYLCLIAKRYLIQLYKDDNVEDEFINDSHDVPEQSKGITKIIENKKVCVLQYQIIHFYT